MTCIVGFTNKKNVWIGGDSAGVGGYDLSIRADKKVFIRDNMIYGFTSSFRMGQILRSCFNRPKHHPDISDYDYLCSDYIDSLRECLTEKKFVTIRENEATGGTFLLGYKGSLYTIFSDFQVAENVLPFTAVGCGESYALGYLYSCYTTLKEDKTVRKALTSALECSVEFSAGVRGPFTIMKL